MYLFVRFYFDSFLSLHFIFPNWKGIMQQKRFEPKFCNLNLTVTWPKYLYSVNLFSPLNSQILPTIELQLYTNDEILWDQFPQCFNSNILPHRLALEHCSLCYYSTLSLLILHVSSIWLNSAQRQNYTYVNCSLGTVIARVKSTVKFWHSFHDLPMEGIFSLVLLFYIEAVDLH